MLNRTTSWLLCSSVVVLLRFPNDAPTRAVACGRGFFLLKKKCPHSELLCRTQSACSDESKR